MKKTGLIVEGGANRVYFAVGAMDSLMKNNIKADYITGSSAGIANAASFASGQMGRSLEIALNHVPKKEYMGIKHLLNPKNRSYFNIDYIFSKLPNEFLPYDYDALDRFEGEVEAAVTNIETGKAEYLKIDSSDKSWRAILASCSLPIMFPPVVIDGKSYSDGGIADSIPYKRALDKGCKKIIVILSREREYSKKPGKSTDLAKFLYRKYPEFSKALSKRYAMYNEQRERLFALEKEGKAMLIEPESTVGWKRTENRPEVLKEMYDCGYEITENKMDEIKKYLEM